jgi:hypothetical protein
VLTDDGGLCTTTDLPRARIVDTRTLHHRGQLLQQVVTVTARVPGGAARTAAYTRFFQRSLPPAASPAASDSPDAADGMDLDE